MRVLVTVEGKLREVRPVYLTHTGQVTEQWSDGVTGRPWFGDVYFRDVNEMFEWWLSNYGPRGGLVQAPTAPSSAPSLVPDLTR